MTTTSSALTNLRPVGGPALQADRPRTVFRANPEPVGAEAYPADLAAVIDLRRIDETNAVPHPLATTGAYRSVPLFDPAAEVESAADAVELEDQYIDWLDRHRSGIAAALRAIAATDGDVLVCCSAGKDRTGIVSALLARHWGDSLDAIGEDYAASAAGLVDRFARERAVSADPEATANAQRCVPEIMTTVIDHVERRWGSVDGYVRAIGLTDEEIAAL
ncbi:tyrosine-protein phosphatase [Curtobacterium pusillum]|uniref:Tyrosine-protein phosphatase n=1 Tax=Curtobacterium pusillum TaxID=69373 RepID=A0ABX2M5Z4_9MICO|nr:tyrosine-protein phosphatase [Curtobacterium pusillum]NUU12763.1 tyrosine-protein phosphatase [Curtobacterium pusillum]GLK30228.1 protein-tyrosine-phosphatase [Curtobacterium pusillum]